MHSFILKHFFISSVFDFYFINSLLLTLVFTRLLVILVLSEIHFISVNVLWFSLCYLRNFFVFSDFFEGLKKFMSKNSFRTWDKFSSKYFFYFLFMFHSVQVLCWIYSDFYLSLEFFCKSVCHLIKHRVGRIFHGSLPFFPGYYFNFILETWVGRCGC